VPGMSCLRGTARSGGEGEVFFEAEGAGEGAPPRGGERGDDGGGEDSLGGTGHGGSFTQIADIQ